jgi:small conductance mechanosensitive channel
MLEKPEVWGAQELSSKEVTMRIVAKTAPMRQWEVARELRARVKATLDAAGIAPAGPDTIVITAPPGAPAPADKELSAAAEAAAAAGPPTETATEDPLASAEAADPLAATELSGDSPARTEDEPAGPPS